MTVGIMQPYLFPYIGYFQLIQAVDVFVVYDNIQFTKKGWIHRNRFLQNGADTMFSLSLKKDSDFLDVNQRELADVFFTDDRKKMLNQLRNAYQKAPHFKEVFPIIEQCLMQDERNLFTFIYSTIQAVCSYLEIPTKLMVSSSIEIDHSLRNKHKVLALCHALHAQQYINPSGGVELYEKAEFSADGIALQFIKSQPIVYPQLGSPFVPWLSIVDVMMFNDRASIQTFLRSYELF
jgi:hypothetical protein